MVLDGRKKKENEIDDLWLPQFQETSMWDLPRDSWPRLVKMDENGLWLSMVIAI